MITADFNVAKEVYFNGQKIKEVYLGAVHIWPIKPVIKGLKWRDALGNEIQLTFPATWGGNKNNVDGLSIAVSDGLNVVPLARHSLIRSVTLIPNQYGAVDDYYMFESADLTTRIVVSKRRWISDTQFPNVYLSFVDQIWYHGRIYAPVDSPFFYVVARGH